MNECELTVSFLEKLIRVMPELGSLVQEDEILCDRVVECIRLQYANLNPASKAKDSLIRETVRKWAMLTCDAAAALSGYDDLDTVGNVHRAMMAKPSEVSLADIKSHDSAHGRHFFSRENMKFFRSTCYPTVFHGNASAYFVTSEVDYDGSNRKFTVRRWHPSLGVDSASPHRAFGSRKEAERFARLLAGAVS